MRIAVLSDIHANIYALEAVLKDAGRNSIDRYAFLGDTVYFGLTPRRTYERVMDLNPLVFIKGNTDANIEDLETITPSSQFERYLLDIAQFTAGELEEEQKKHLKTSPIVLEKKIEGQRILFCHGSPYSFSERLEPQGKTGKDIARKIGKETSSLIICGHTHIPGEFTVSGRKIVNPGAVGYSFNGDRYAHYALLDITEKGINVNLKHIAWDSSAYETELISSLDRFPLLESVLYALREGRPMNNFKKRFSR